MKLYQTLVVMAAAVTLSSGAWAEGYSGNGSTAGSQSYNDTTQSGQMSSDADANVTASGDAQPPASYDSERIQTIQQNLQDEGYQLSADGVWGPQTAQAIRRFQQQNDLDVTGTLNSETLAALDVNVNSTNNPENRY